jgi:hypothetical protein
MCQLLSPYIDGQLLYSYVSMNKNEPGQRYFREIIPQFEACFFLGLHMLSKLIRRLSRRSASQKHYLKNMGLIKSPEILGVATFSIGVRYSHA